MVSWVTENTFILRPEGKEEGHAHAYGEVAKPALGCLFCREDMIRRIGREVIDRLRRDAV